MINIQAHWQKVIHRSTSRKIFNAAIIIATWSIVAKLLGMFKEVTIAWKIGASDELEIFLVALTLSTFGINIISGSLNVVIVPTYIQIRNDKGILVAKRFIASSIGVVCVCLFTFSGLLAAISIWLLPKIATGFSLEKIVLAQLTFYLLLPIIIVSGITTVWTGILNATGKFNLPSLAPAIVPLCILTFVILFSKQQTLEALVLGTLSGYLMYFVVVAIEFKRQDLPLSLSFKWKEFDWIPDFKQFSILTFASIFTSTIVFIDQSIASQLGPGAIAQLNYGNKLPTLIMGLGATAIGTAILPYISNAISNEDWGQVQHIYKRYTLLVTAVSTPMVILMCSLSYPIIEAIFQRGAFNQSDTYIVSQIQIFYSLQIPFFVLGILTARIINALKYNQILLYMAIIYPPLNYIFDLIFSQYFGISGIALASALLSIINTVLLSIFVMRILKYKQILHKY